MSIDRNDLTLNRPFDGEPIAEFVSRRAWEVPPLQLLCESLMALNWHRISDRPIADSLPELQALALMACSAIGVPLTTDGVISWLSYHPLITSRIGVDG